MHSSAVLTDPWDTGDYGADEFGEESRYDEAARSSSKPSSPTVSGIVDSESFAPGGSPAGAPAPAPAPAHAETVRELQARIAQMQGTKLDARSLPTHPVIASLLPGGALKQGAAYSVEHSATLLMALLAGPSAAGSWCGVVGVPDFGAEAAANYGIDLERLVLVPHPGDQWLGVTAAIADVMTIVVTRPPRQASDSAVARLAARLRQRGSTLIVVGTWPQTDAMLSISHSRWSGVGDGYGHLAAREATVTVSTRAGSRPRSARLWLPDHASQFSTAELDRLDRRGVDQRRELDRLDQRGLDRRGLDQRGLDRPRELAG